MKRLHTTAAVTALATTLLISSTARADDYKMYHGSDCKVFGSTAWTDLAFSGYGVKNLASSARNIICPITKDTAAFWDGDAVTPTNKAYLDITFQTGSVAASYGCTVYVTTRHDMIAVNSYAISSGGPRPANTLFFNGTFDFNSVATSFAGYYDKAYMLCTLGPQVRLLGYYVWEQGATD